MMHILIMTDAVRDQIRQVMAYAHDKAHWYYPPAPMPGFDKRHCVQVGDYRCTYSITCFPMKRDPSSRSPPYRQLGITVPQPKGDHYVSPVANVVRLLAYEFGFTDSTDARPWKADVVDEGGPVFLLAQLYPLPS